MDGKDAREIYGDIFNLPHHQSKRHPHMSLYDRAAQFNPFSALSGYDAVVQEEVRQTEAQRELSETEQERLDRKLSRIAEMIEKGEHPQVTLTCFVPDERKAGGRYEEAAGRIKRIDPVEGRIIFYASNGISNGASVEIGRIVGIGFEGEDGTR